MRNIPTTVDVYRKEGAPDENADRRSAANGERGSTRASVVLLGAAIVTVFLAAGAIYRSALFGTPTAAQEDAAARPEVPKNIDKAAPEKSAGRAPLTAREERELRPKAAFRECEACPEVVVIPAGEFLMGSPDTELGRLKFEGPVYKVVIAAAFAVGRYAITRDQFKAFVDATGYRFGESCHAQAAGGWVDRAKHSFLAPPGFTQDGNHPVVCVSWKDADAYVKWLSARTNKPYRLLTEAEREYIARAGTMTPYWWGPTISSQQANFDTQPRPNVSPHDTTAPAWAQRIEPPPGSEPPSGGPLIVEPGVAIGGTVSVLWGQPNPWGLFQVHGNVAEWVQDCWNPNYARASTDGSAALSGDCSLRVMRGGAWSSWPEDIRAAYREMAAQGERYYSVGFRAARDLHR